MPGLLPDVDPDGLLEFSVVYTDRALNHMSRRFGAAMQDILGTLKSTYAADAAVIVPGSGSFGMESVARQFARERPVLILRNGWFSYRWTQILDMARLTDRVTVLKARQQAGGGAQAPFTPAPLDDVVATIRRERPAVVFAPHVETSSGIVLPDDYLRAVGQATREAGGLFVLDCIASGALWVDMRACAVDVLISAPQKGWSSSPCGALVMLGQRALDALPGTASDSFSLDLNKWLQIAASFESGQHAYHATMPTDALMALHRNMQDAKRAGFEALRRGQIELGQRVRRLLESRGFASVAADGFQSPSVVVSYTTDPDIRSGRRFAEAGVQSASGVPLMCDEPEGFSTFRLGLLGLDKWNDVAGTEGLLAQALDRMGIGATTGQAMPQPKVA